MFPGKMPMQSPWCCSGTTGYSLRTTAKKDLLTRITVNFEAVVLLSLSVPHDEVSTVQHLTECTSLPYHSRLF